jgi:hypothetical protein
MTSRQPLDVALSWAEALDHDAFDRLPSYLTPDCVYHAPGGEIVGPEAIVASYRASSEWAHDTFDTITWDSECAAEDDDRVLITFIDITDHAGLHHVYRCQQLVHIDADGLIDDITHISIESEERALADFFDRVGAVRGP